MKVAVLGYGIEGQVSAEYWHANGDEVAVCEQKEDLKVPNQYQKKLGPDHLKDLHKFDVIVRTSGLHPQKILDANPEHPEIKSRITTSLNEFLKNCPSQKLIGITGSKGKGTTSTLAAKILEAAGHRAHLGGNIGIAPLAMLPNIKPEDFVVLELSSFQLIDMNQRIPTAVCLVMYPEHLDWHADLEEYHKAKGQLFANQQPEDTAVYNVRSAVSQKLAFLSPGHKIGYDVPPLGESVNSKEAAYTENGTVFYKETAIMQAADVAMPGRHNLENLCAAIAAVWPFIDGNVEAIKTVATTFTGLKHHLEFVAEINGVKYVNDSYSTMPDATIAALEATPEPKVLILGGRNKNLPLEKMIKAVVNSNVKQVVLIGSLAGQLKEMLAEQGYTNVVLSENGMAEIVEKARSLAEPGDVVLLSPGLAAKGDGFYIDNVDRGNQFKEIVSKLQ